MASSVVDTFREGIMNKLDHHDTISLVIYADYCRLDKRFRDAIKWAINEARICNVNTLARLSWHTCVISWLIVGSYYLF